MNILPGLRFLECAQRYPKKRYFFVSTGGALYGNCPLASESILPQPSSYHGAAKLALDSFLGVIRTLLERAMDGGELVVYGDDGAVRDYLYIDDMVTACVAVLSAPALTCNIGSGQGVALRDLISIVERVTGKPLAVVYEAARASDVKRIILDTALARIKLDWAPGISLEDGIGRTWRSLQ